jgi:hypothetical protein
MSTLTSYKDGSLGSPNMSVIQDGSLGYLNEDAYQDGSLGFIQTARIQNALQRVKSRRDASVIQGGNWIGVQGLGQPSSAKSLLMRARAKTKNAAAPIKGLGCGCGVGSDAPPFAANVGVLALLAGVLGVAYVWSLSGGRR